MKYLNITADPIEGHAQLTVTTDSANIYDILGYYRWINIEDSVGFGGVVKSIRHATEQESRGYNVATPIYVIDLESKKIYLDSVPLPSNLTMYESPNDMILYCFEVVKDNDASTLISVNTGSFTGMADKREWRLTGQSVGDLLREICNRSDIYFYHEMRYYEDAFRFFPQDGGDTAFTIDLDTAHKEKQIDYNYAKELVSVAYNRVVNYSDWYKQFCVFPSTGDKYLEKDDTGYVTLTWSGVLGAKYSQAEQELEYGPIAIRIAPIDVNLTDTDLVSETKRYMAYPIKMPSNIKQDGGVDSLTKHVMINNAVILARLPFAGSKWQALKCSIQLPEKVPADGLLPYDKYAGAIDDIYAILEEPPVFEYIEDIGSADPDYPDTETLADMRDLYGATWNPQRMIDVEFTEFRLYALANVEQGAVGTEFLNFKKDVYGQSATNPPRRVKYNHIPLTRIQCPFITQSSETITNGNSSYLVFYLEIDPQPGHRYHSFPTNEYNRRRKTKLMQYEERILYKTPIDPALGRYNLSFNRISVTASRCFAGAKTFQIVRCPINGKERTMQIEGVKIDTP